MKKAALACALSAVLTSPLGAADDSLVRFDGGIGVIPVSNVAVNATTGAVTVTRNIVRNVNPAGQIWVINRLKADVGTDGHIVVQGRGLLLGGGNAIGSNANNAKVFATLMCDAAGTQHSTPTDAAVALAANGDFTIDDTLTPAVPDTCDSPVLLIRNAANLAWFAAGIPKLQ